MWPTFLGAFAALLTPVILLGGTFLGIFTAIEAAAVAAFWSLIRACFVHREWGFARLVGVFRRAA
ncbi:MAG: TRAP transporter large permease subunit, partial [Pseudomonadota bacterium]